MGVHAIGLFGTGRCVCAVSESVTALLKTAATKSKSKAKRSAARAAAASGGAEAAAKAE